MALTTCPDCAAQVSDRAPTCPKCGGPIAGRAEAMATRTPLTTTQATSKHLKLHTLGAVLCIVIGFVWIIGAAQNHDNSGVWAALLILGGFGWYVVTRFRIWWHHK